MKTFYCVTSSYYDDGKSIANVTDIVDADEKPMGSFKSVKGADIYADWFDSFEEAEQFAIASRKA